MNTELTLKENQEFELDVYNSDFDHIFMVEGSIEIESTGVTFCLLSKVSDCCGNTLDTFVSKEWVISAIESKEEVQDRISELAHIGCEDYTESWSYIHTRI